MQDLIVTAFINEAVKLKGGDKKRIIVKFVAKHVKQARSGEQQTLKACQTEQLANLARQVKHQRPRSQTADVESTQNEQPAAAEDRQDTCAAAAGVSQQQPAPPGNARFTINGKQRLNPVGQQAGGEGH